MVGGAQPPVTSTASMPVSLSSSVTSIPGTKSLGAVTGILPISAVTATFSQPGQLERSVSLHSRPTLSVCPLESGESLADTVSLHSDSRHAKGHRIT